MESVELPDLQPDQSRVPILPAALESFSDAVQISAQRVPPFFTPRGVPAIDVSHVKEGRFRKLQWYQSLIAMSWIAIISLSLAVYVGAVVTLGALYMCVGVACDVTIGPVSALYFSIVTFSANGGYWGEDASLVPGNSVCAFTRVLFVILGSFGGLILAALIAAIFVSKATATSRMRHRIVFSDLCVLRQENQSSIFDTSSQPNPSFTIQFRVGMVNAVLATPTSCNLHVFAVCQYHIKNSENQQQDCCAVEVTTVELPWVATQERHSKASSVNLFMPTIISVPLFSQQRTTNSSSEQPSTILERLGECLPQLRSDLRQCVELVDVVVVASLTGLDGMTGQTYHAHHHYAISSIIAGYHFVPIMAYRRLHSSRGSRRDILPQLELDMRLFNALEND